MGYSILPATKNTEEEKQEPGKITVRLSKPCVHNVTALAVAGLEVLHIAGKYNGKYESLQLGWK